MLPDIKKPLRKFAPHFIKAREASCNESDTVDRLRQFFEDVLGYEPMDDISREIEMKRKYVDLCLKIDGNIRLLVEAKAAAIPLRVRHIDQAKHYASENGFRWVLLTNGVDWNLYHVTFNEEDGIEYDLAFAVTLADGAMDEVAKKLAILHKKAIAKGELEKFWKHKSAMCAGSIAKALFQSNVLNVIRREIRRQCNVLIDPEDLATAVQEMLSVEAREEIGPVRIRRRKKRVPAKPKLKTLPAANTAKTPKP
jgi:predicted type IV restriction endonuclease